MYGVLTGDPDLARADIGDVTYFLASRTDGGQRDPVPGTVTTVSCFGDTGAVERSPDRAAVAADRTRATPRTEGHHWGTVCPTDERHRETVLGRLDGLEAVRLTTVGFPGADFCHCDRCERRFAASNTDDWTDWRVDVITSFVAEAAERVDGPLAVTLYPDPHPAGLRERTGLDPRRLAPHVDGVLVPLCGDYGTPYWVETLASGFGRLLEDLSLQITVQLSVEGSDAATLADVTRMVEPHCDAVVYGTFPGDEAIVSETIRRRTATTQPA